MAQPLLTIRTAHDGDRAFIERLGKRTLMDSVPVARRPDPADVLRSFDRLLGIVGRQSHVTFVAERDGNNVGFLILLDDLPDEVTGEPQAFVAYMAVEREARGGGVGSALLKAAEEDARKKGLPYVTLMVTEDNGAARGLYDSAGYVTERRLLCKRL